jgi:regulatory protein
MIVRTRFTERGQSRRAIAQELRRKGIADETAEQALAQVDEDDEAEAALDVARVRLRRTRSLEHAVRVRRALGALGRKGYSSAVSMQAIRTALAEEPPSDGSTDDGADDTGDDPGADDSWMQPDVGGGEVPG